MATSVQVEIFRYIVFIGGSLSFCGCLYMILTFFLCKNLRKDPFFKNIIYLILFDIQLPIWGTFQLYTPIEDNYLPCELLAFYEIFLRISSIFWSKVFADSVYRIIIKRDKKSVSTFQLMLSAVLFPLVLASIPFLMKDYGASDLNCAFSNKNQGLEAFMIPMICVFVPFWTIFIYNLIVFWKIAIYIKDRFGDMTTFYKLLLYPLTLLPVNLATFLYRMEVTLFGAVFPNIELVFIALLVLQGFFNTLIYGMDSAVRAEVRNGLRSIFQENTEDWEDKQTQISEEKFGFSPTT